MYNKVLVPNPRYNRLKMSAGLLMLFALLYVAVLIVGALIGTRNFNGDVTEITGKVTFVGEDSDTTIVELDGDKRYTAGPIETKTDDWSALKDKDVIYPRKAIEKHISLDHRDKNGRRDNRRLSNGIGRETRGKSDNDDNSRRVDGSLCIGERGSLRLAEKDAAHDGKRTCRRLLRILSKPSTELSRLPQGAVHNVGLLCTVLDMRVGDDNIGRIDRRQNRIRNP